MTGNFCTNCGTALNPGAKFCGKCGTRITTASEPAVIQQQSVPVAPQKQAQPYKFIIPAQYKKGLLSTKACTLIFTDTEVIVAMVDNKLMQKHLSDVKESVRGEKFMKRTAAVMKAGYTYSDRYWTISRNNIMAETAGNFIIACNTVQTVRFSKGSTTSYSDDTSTNTPPSLVFKTTGDKFSFVFNLSVPIKTFLPMLQTAFPGHYKGPKK